MASPSLENKTVRPGSLGAYSYYRSSRRPDRPAQPAFIAARPYRLMPRRLAVIVALMAALVAVPLVRADRGPATATSDNSSKSSKPGPTPAAAAVVTAPSTAGDSCAGNGLSKLILVSISQRHLWACAGDKTVYDAPVITGMSAYPATMTPPGTYHIYVKQTDTTLTGTDITGSWSDPVSYWMPFLDNQYGTYGFHDATWRASDTFGNVSPESSDASHGCVELPLGASKWLYDWSGVGTAVSIRS